MFVNYKLQKELLDFQKESKMEQLLFQEKILRQQRKYDDGQLFWSRFLALTTVALAIFVLAIAKFG